MIKKTIPLILHPHFTKISSVCIGYMLWAFIAQFQWTTTIQKVPLCFYQNNEQTIEKQVQGQTMNDRAILAPDFVMISVYGQRKDIYFFNASESALHIDLSSYSNGTHEIQLSKENLFLPDTLKLIHLVPAHISIKISSNNLNKELTEQ
jgi:hypothetical protein